MVLVQTFCRENGRSGKIDRFHLGPQGDFLGDLKVSEDVGLRYTGQEKDLDGWTEGR